MITIITVLFVVTWNQQQFVDSQYNGLYMVRPDGYKAQEIPVAPKGSPTFNVSVDLTIWSITEVSLEKQHMEVDLILTVQWIDDRLTVQSNVSSSRKWVGIGKEVDYLWSPTLIFFNCKGCSPITFKSNSRVPVYINKETGVFYAQVRFLHRFSCNIDLRFYPMDVQNCPIQIYTDEDITEVIILTHSPPEENRKMKSNVTMSEFAPPTIHASDCTSIVEVLDDCSCLELRVRFERLLGNHMTTYYLPTSFIVVLSWISFWLPTDVIPARVALGLTSLLTLTTRLDQAQRNLPEVSYAKAIDVWMLACIFFVSLSLLEFAVSNYMLRKHAECGERKNKTSSGMHKIPLMNKIRKYLVKYRRKVLPLQYQDTHPSLKKQNGMLWDRVSRILFPASFIVFNLVYWNYYLYSLPA